MWMCAVWWLLVVSGTVADEPRAPLPAAHKPVWFYRAFRTTMTREARRMFGGAPVPADSWPAACVLLDGRLVVRCSCSAVHERFVLTAAHCVTPMVHYVARAPASSEQLAVRNLFRHKEFNAVQRDEGQGMDVVELRNDVGLVQTEVPISWHRVPLSGDLSGLEQLHQRGAFVRIYGYGQAGSPTMRTAGSDELYTTQLSLATCARASWTHCACGAARGSGVCAGDSGGPVVFDGKQVGVTSMGPVACGKGQMPDEFATSVFTSVAPYVEVLARTMAAPDGGHMTQFRPRMAAAPRAAPAALLPLLVVLSSLVQ